MSSRLKFIPALPEEIREKADPATALAADVLHALGIAVILWCFFYYSLLIPFFVARKVVAAAFVTALLAATLVSLLLLHRVARDKQALGSPELLRNRVRRASWVLVASSWIVITVLIVLDGGIASRGLLLYVGVLVAAGALLGERVALLGTGLFLGTTLLFAILDQYGIRLPRAIPGPPIAAWYFLAFASGLVAVPLVRVFSAFGEAQTLARRRAEETENLHQALRESEARLRTIVETAPDAIFILNTSGCVMEVNQAASRDLGYTREELAGMHLTKFVSPAFQVRARARFPELGGPMSYESIHVRKDGAEFPVELNTRKILYRGEPALLGIARDITERKLTEERLRALNGQLLAAQEHERSRIARDLHDDITQKLAGLAIEIGLLRRHALPPATAVLVATLQEQAQRVAADLREIAREIHPGILEYVGLGAALESLCAQVSRQREIVIRCSSRHVPEEIPRDISVTLYRIAQEAVGNAVKHADASVITVTLSGAAGSGSARSLLLTVADNGNGFVPDRARGGSGMGLLSIEERVRVVNGSFEICSAPGDGTRLKVEVPMP